MEDFGQAGISSDCGIFSVREMLGKTKDGVVEMQWHPDPKPEMLVDLKNDEVLSKLILDIEEYSKQWEKENDFINRFSQAIDKKDNEEITNLKKERDKALGIRLGGLYEDIVGINDEEKYGLATDEENRAQQESFAKGEYVPPILKNCRIDPQASCRHGVCDFTIAMYFSQNHWPAELDKYKSDYYVFTNFVSSTSSNHVAGYHTVCVTEQNLVIESNTGGFDGARYSVREEILGHSVQDLKNGVTGIYKVWDATEQRFIENYSVTYGTGFDGSEQSEQIYNQRKSGQNVFLDFPKLEQYKGKDLSYRNIKIFAEGVEEKISLYNQGLVLSKINEKYPGILIHYEGKDITLDQFLKLYKTLDAGKAKEVNDKNFLSEILQYSELVIEVAVQFDKDKNHIIEGLEAKSLSNSGLQYKIGDQEIKVGRKLF